MPISLPLQMRNCISESYHQLFLKEEQISLPISGRAECLFFPPIPLTSCMTFLLTAEVFPRLLGSQSPYINCAFVLGLWTELQKLWIWNQKGTVWSHEKLILEKYQTHRDSKSRGGQTEIRRERKRFPVPQQSHSNLSQTAAQSLASSYLLMAKAAGCVVLRALRFSIAGNKCILPI